MSKKKPVSTKRGQHHQHKSFWINLVKDNSLTKIDTNVVRKHPDSFEKKKFRFEKRNADPVYFRQTVCQEFPLLSGGVEFSFWRLSKDNPTLIPLPPDINNAASLCNFDELNRSSLYIRLQAAPSSVPLSSSSTQPQSNHQIPDMIDSAGQQAVESSMSHETTSLHVVTDTSSDDDDKKQILSHSSWNVTTMMGSDGELLILPLYPASAIPASVSMQPTASTVEEAVANDHVTLDMPAKENSSVDLSRGNAHSSCIPKKRKITSKPDQETIANKHHQSLSAWENNRSNEPTGITESSLLQGDYTYNLPTTIRGNDSCPETNDVPSANTMDYNSGEGNGQLFTHSASLMFNDGQQDQLFPYNREYSSSLANFNNHGTRYQQNSCQQPSASADLPFYVDPSTGFAMPQIYTSHPGNSTWISNQMNMNRLPDSDPNLMNVPHLHNFTNPFSVRMLDTLQFPPQQRTLISLDNLNTQQSLDSHMPMLPMQQPLPQLKMVSKNPSGSGSTSRSEKNDTGDSSLPHVEQIGKIRHGYSYHVKDIAAMNGKVYFVYEEKETLRVFSSSSPFQKEKDITVNGMKYPRCISSCAEKNSLFISDGKSESSICIWKVKDGDEVVSEKFLEDFECRSLSVTPNGELLILDGKHKGIHLYRPDGRCLLCVKFPDEYEFGEPQFAVSSLRDSFYVSSLRTRSDKLETHWCMIYEMSKDGDLRKTFGGRAGRGSGQLSGRDHPLALDKYGRVIVGDQGNHRILLLDSNLQLLTILLNKDDLKYLLNFLPETSFYVNANLIFVKDGWGNDVAIFSLKQFRPSRLLNSSCNVFSRATSDTEEYHLACSIDITSKEEISKEEISVEEIRGVATLMDNIYVLTEAHIKAYGCTNPYQRHYEQCVGEDLWDIAANVSDRCLYVTDKDKQCVWSVGIDLRRKKWLEGVGSPYTLSVAKDGSVLILSNRDQSLDIYDKDGQRLQKIRLSSDRKLFLRHAVKMSYSSGNETYLVCHGHNINQDATADDDYYSDCFSHEVLLVSSTGDVIQAFGGKFGSNADQLHLPSHMVLDRDNTLLVADCKNNRVLRLNHQLKLLNIPLNKDVQSVNEPFRLCYAENTGQIIVASSRTVDIFVHGDTIQCQSQDQSFTSDTVANTDEPEPEMPNVQMIGQVDKQMLKHKVCKGAAVLQDEMYLIYDGVNTVCVHSSDPPYTQLNPIVIEEMEKPWCIVASVEHDCIYIAESDEEESNIWRLLRNDQKSETFLEDIECLKSISLTEEGHLLLLTYENYDKTVFFVSTYDADARCIQNIAIQQDIKYAVKLGATKFFVNSSYETYKYYDSRNALMEVSLDGAILHSYGPFVRTYFDCDGMAAAEGNQIFVIDKAKGGRILVFGSTARLIGVLLSKDDHQIKEITGLCYVKDKRQLVFSGSDQIVIYQLRQDQETEMDGHERKRAKDVENPILCCYHEGSDQLLFSRKVGDEFDSPVIAIAKLKDKIYLLYDVYLSVCSPQDVITKIDFPKDDVIKRDDRSRSKPCGYDLWDIAASETDLCLYVTDRSNYCVWRVTLDHKIRKWLTDIGSPYTLSVIENGSLCILSNVYKHLDIYDRSGTRKKSIRLPTYMKFLLHALQTPTETYVVSWTLKRLEPVKDSYDSGDDYSNVYGENVVFEETHRNCICAGDCKTQKRGLVCEVSSDGDILRSFSVDDPQTNQIDASESRFLFQLKTPCHLAIDLEGRVFVADYYYNNRVLLLDSQLKYLANLMENNAEEDCKAKRLCYDKHTKELLVIERNSDSINLKCIRM